MCFALLKVHMDICTRVYEVTRAQNAAKMTKISKRSQLVFQLGIRFNLLTKIKKIHISDF